MTRITFFVFLIFISLIVFSQQETAKPKLSPLTKKYLKEIESDSERTNMPEGFIYKKQADGSIFLSSIIKVNNATAVEKSLYEIGVKIGTKAGNIWTVQIPLESVLNFVETPEIAYIQLDEPVFPEMEEARKTTRVDSVHKGIGLPIPYSGRGIVMGVIDFGFDYNHPTFYDTLGSKYRIKRAWELNTQGTPPSGYSYGHELTDTFQLKTQGTDNPFQTHGTSVAGIAAGSGFGSSKNSRLRGIAFESDIVIVGVRRDSIEKQWMQSSFTDFIDGINYIFNYAESVNKPAVVNISWGGHTGPHDGSSLFNQACDNLSGAGKIIVMSAGNSGARKIHLDKKFTATDTLLKTFLTFSKEDYKRTWIDMWGDTGKTFCAQVTLYANGIAGNSTEFVCTNDSIYKFYLIGENGIDTCSVEVLTSSSEFNDKPHLIMDIHTKTMDSVSVSIYATDGSVDAWNEYYYYGYTRGYTSSFTDFGMPDAVDGKTNVTVSDMGSAKSVLMVGAYSSKVSWTDIKGNGWAYQKENQGDIASFSSRGPMANSIIKPDITGPGLTLATAVSSYDTTRTPSGANKIYVVAEYENLLNGKKYYFSEFTGTSASAPAASGIVALMLQADPTLTPEQVKNILLKTAIIDNNTGIIPMEGNTIWGKGKINAYGALKATLQRVNIYDFKDISLDVVLFPNPGKGNFILDYVSEKQENITVEVTNTMGEIVFNETKFVTLGFNRLNLNLSDYSMGIYLVSLSSSYGTVTLRAVVK